MTKHAQAVALTALVLTMTAHSAQAAKPTLNGTFSAVGFTDCQSNDVGFTAPPSLTALGPTYQVVDSWQSTMQFFANGSVTEIKHGQYGLPGNSQPAGDYDSVCQYTSTANPDGSFTLVGECTGHVLSGVAAGEHNVASPVIWKVFASSGVILLSATAIDVQTLDTDLSGKHYRICGGNGTGVK